LNHKGKTSKLLTFFEHVNSCGQEERAMDIPLISFPHHILLIFGRKRTTSKAFEPCIKEKKKIVRWLNIEVQNN